MNVLFYKHKVFAQGYKLYWTKKPYKRCIFRKNEAIWLNSSAFTKKTLNSYVRNCRKILTYE